MGFTPDKLMKLREPNRGKELAGQFKFTNHKSLDRVYDTFAKQNQAGKSSRILMQESLKS
jgi:hypothetical protein